MRNFESYRHRWTQINTDEKRTEKRKNQRKSVSKKKLFLFYDYLDEGECLMKKEKRGKEF